MSNTYKVTTNNVPRDVIDACYLNEDERAEFDYIDWDAIDEGSDSASFVRFKGTLYDLAEFEVWSNPESPLNVGGWHAFRSDTFFSGLLVRYVEEDNNETVVIGTYYA